MPMSFVKIQKALRACSQLIREALPDAEPRQFGHYDEIFGDSDEAECLGLPHCLYMVNEALSWEEDRREKMMRWLGFVQGFMWATLPVTLNQLKEMNKPDPEDAKEEEETPVWFGKWACVWREDPIPTSESETLPMAWERIFKHKFNLTEKFTKVDPQNPDCYLTFLPDRVALISEPGHNAIFVFTDEGKKLHAACSKHRVVHES